MLRLVQTFGPRMRRSVELTRRFSSEVLKESEDSERKKMRKIFELEIDVSFDVMFRSYVANIESF